ncbi:LOW QUALITY PROTEIN: ras and EF-hand domain-containing protein-like [Meles meles]|uniref:LOW QUALITY PROTEIN: ras and EF-hand domain-containing protein-like n=1 Tax=Meles meles TaxID=9662 RepID=UPI001E6A04E9|nr:LOW QUALITY PROTEIN: ras and EF-hand domain-containing protein-like [Meles meles]
MEDLLKEQLLALTEQPVFYSKDPGKRYRCSPGSGRYPKSKSPQTRLSQLEPGAEGTAGSGGVGARTTRPSYLAGRSQIRAESVRAAPLGSQSRAAATALYAESAPGRERAARGTSVGGTLPRPAQAPPSHWALNLARPLLRSRIFLQAAQPARGGSRCGSRRQQVAPDFPQLPLSQWAARPVAPRSPLGYPRRAGWRYGDREDLDHLRSFFAACDTNRWGRLEREEFIALCAELRVRPAYAKALFQRLDADRDGAITFQEFARGFRGRHRGWAPREPAPPEPASASAHAGPDPEDSQEEEGDGDALGAPWGLASAGQPWQDFQARLGKEAKFIPRKEQVSTLYLNINLVEPRLNKSYEHVIRNFIHEIKLQSTEMENLPIAENQKVKKDLLESQTNIAFLQSKLDALKSDYADQTLNSERSSCSSYMDEDCDSLAFCDPVQRMNCEVDSLPESCFDSGLSTLRDSNEYDSEVEYRHQRALQRSHGTQESFGDDASDVDVADIRDEEAFGAEGVAAVLDWKPQGSASEGSIVSSSRKPISALSPQTDVVNDDHKSSSSQKAYKIVLAGDAAVGKSSFLMRLCKNEFRGNTSATLGVDFQMKTLLVDGERTVLQLWDTAGQERFRSIAKSYFRRADGVLLLYDVTCEKSFLNVREWVDMIEDATQESVPIMLVGNNADLRDAAAAEEQKCVPGYLGEKLAMTMGHYSVKPAPKTAQI